MKKEFGIKSSYLIEDPYNATLKMHKLSGRLKNFWSFRIDFDVTVLFFIDDNGNAVFVDIGTHKEVY